MNDVAQALEDGLTRIRTRGLAKGFLCDDEGRVCARGALIDAQFGQFWHVQATAEPILAADVLLASVIREQYADRKGSLQPVDFNNHPDTTQEEVERVFEKAIARAYETI